VSGGEEEEEEEGGGGDGRHCEIDDGEQEEGEEGGEERERAVEREEEDPASSTRPDVVRSKAPFLPCQASQRATAMTGAQQVTFMNLCRLLNSLNFYRLLKPRNFPIFYLRLPPPPPPAPQVATLRVLCGTPSVLLAYAQGGPGCVPWGVVGVFLNDYLAQDKRLGVGRESTRVGKVRVYMGGKGLAASANNHVSSNRDIFYYYLK
jgi:hypothetical protein